MPNDEYREQFLFQGDPKERRVEGIVEVWRDGKRLGHFSTMHRQPALPIKAYGEREEMEIIREISDLTEEALGVSRHDVEKP